jgi:hypothetical protein
MSVAECARSLSEKDGQAGVILNWEVILKEDTCVSGDCNLSKAVIYGTFTGHEHGYKNLVSDLKLMEGQYHFTPCSTPRVKGRLHHTCIQRDSLGFYFLVTVRVTCKEDLAIRCLSKYFLKYLFIAFLCLLRPQQQKCTN